MTLLKLKNKYLSFCLINLSLISFISNAQIKTPQIDDRIMIHLADHRSPAETETMMFLSNTFKYGEIGIPAGLLIGGVIGNNKEMRQNSLYVASSTAISYGLTLLIKQLAKRPRPFVQNINIVPVSRPSSSSFPSGHTSTTFASATALSVAYPKWYVIAPAFVWAGSVGYSRMYLGVHYPTDVAAGAILGSGTSLLLNNLRSNK